ncbi:MAG TPA: hypothetical protein P5572_05800 [Phycisphaerae bacterium]|nr:hypothetical protein [Phycisphaerae bacterium]
MKPAPTKDHKSVSRGRRCARAACAIILLGAAFRIYLATTLPVGYDEVYVMGLGLDTMHTGASAALLDVPMTRSTAVAPLWWWIQYLPNGLFGDLSLFGLRLLPVALGIATLWIAWRCAARRFGRPAAVVFLGFVALSDILIFTNSRGEFAESFTVPIIVLLVCAAGRARWTVQRGVLGALLFLTVLVKSILVFGVMLVGEATAALRQPRRRRDKLIGLAASLAIAVLPITAYLGIAAGHFSGQEIHHDALTTSSVPQLLRALVFDYAKIKAHVTGTLRDAAFVMLDFDVWPTTALAAPLLVFAAIGSMGGALRSPRSRRGAARTVLLIWTVVGAAVVVGKGTLGARFHLMYLPAAWMLAALWFTRRGALRKAGPVAAGLVVWAAYAGLTVSWVHWTDGLLSPKKAATVGVALAAVLLLGIWLARERHVALKPMLGGGALLAAIGGLCIAGPLMWSGFARFEPMPRGEELAMLDAARSGREPAPPVLNRTLYIDLANYYLGGAPDTPRSHELALKYARKEAERDPNDARAWAYVGEALLRNRAPLTEVRDAWRRSLELAPSDRLAERLARLEEALKAAPRSD